MFEELTRKDCEARLQSEGKGPFFFMNGFMSSGHFYSTHYALLKPLCAYLPHRPHSVDAEEPVYPRLWFGLPKQRAAV